MLKTTNAEFQWIQLWFSDQNNRPFEAENITKILRYYTSYWIDIIKVWYSAEPKYKKYVKGYGFLPFAGKFGDKYGKRLIDTTTKTGIGAGKTASKRLVQKTAEAIGDLIGNKIADKITSLGKTKVKKKKMKDKKSRYHQEKDTQLLMTWDCFGTI